MSDDPTITQIAADLDTLRQRAEALNDPRLDRFIGRLVGARAELRDRVLLESARG